MFILFLIAGFIHKTSSSPVQVICSINGDRLFHNIALGLGRNNDRAMLILSGLKEALPTSGQRFPWGTAATTPPCALCRTARSRRGGTTSRRVYVLWWSV
jgi:hypothetical protein